MGNGITRCPHEIKEIQEQKKCQYYEKVLYTGNERCTYRRSDGTCFIGGIENWVKSTKGMDSKRSK